jgi:undecaprenyl-diphosphatase
VVNLPNSVDLRLCEAWRGSRPDGALTWLMVALTLLGSGWTAFGLVPLYAFKRARPFARWLGAVWVAAAVLVYGLKWTVRRPRPSGVALWGTTPTDYSFPSGHAAGGFAFAAFVVVLCLAGRDGRRTPWRWLAAVASVAAACGIALSRVYLGVHYPTDVGAAAVLGSVLGAVGAQLYRRTLVR